MLLEAITDRDDLAQTGYLIGCQASGEAIVVDPRRDVDETLRLAAQRGLRIVAVAETHIHADYLSGTRELAARTGARMYVSDAGGPEWRYGPRFDAAVRLHDGDRITIGALSLEAVHTPGHTPEHLSFLLTDGAATNEPGYLLSGDFVFVGDVGRPDLLDETGTAHDTRVPAARAMFASLRDRFLSLPDHVQVLPGHGAGSACGKALGQIATTTVGYERRTAWWAPFLEQDDEHGFVEALLAGQPDAPRYFARMKRDNRHGPELIGSTTALPAYTAAEAAEAVHDGRLLAIDARPRETMLRGTPDGALHLPGPERAASFAAWVIDPEREQRPLILLGLDADQARRMREHLLRVGIDHVAGFTATLDGFELHAPEQIAPTEVEGFERSALLDVRQRGEYAAGHIPGAQQRSASALLWQLDTLPAPDQGPLLSYCQSGTRNSVIASALRREGYRVVEVAGSFTAWSSMAGAVPARAVV